MATQSRRRIGRALIWLGILAWVPYAWLKYVAGGHPPLAPFLTWHLAGVIPGTLVSRWPARSGRRHLPSGAGGTNRTESK